MTIKTSTKNICATVVANDFIDLYMPQANGEYVKVYLYILRHSHEEITDEQIADALELTAGDVSRAISYWRRTGLLEAYEERAEQAPAAARPEKEAPAGNGSAGNGPAEDLPGAPAPPAPPVYAADYVRLEKDEEFVELLYCLQRYLSRIFSQTDVDTVAYLYDSLRMPRELIEYLVEICVQKGKTSLRYIETIARDWHSRGIMTVEQARQDRSVYASEVWGVMKAFGLNDRSPGAVEQQYIEKWFRTYGFSQDIVYEACARTLEAAHQPSFPYADSILTRWREENVRSMEDIERLDRRHRERRSGAKTGTDGRAASKKKGGFAQRGDDLDSQVLENINRRLSEQ